MKKQDGKSEPRRDRRAPSRPSTVGISAAAPRSPVRFPKKRRSSEAVALFARKKQRREDRNRFFGLFSLGFIAGLLAVLALALLSVSLLMKSDANAKKNEIKVRIEGAEEFSLPLSRAYQKGILYLDFTPVASLCGFSSVSDSESVTYSFLSSSGAVQTIRFTYGSDVSQINGEDVSMSGAACREDDRVLIPFDYINSNVGGLSAEYDEANRIISVTRDKLSASTPKRPVYDEICLYVQPAAPLTPIFASDDIPGLDNLLFKAELAEYEDAMDPLDTRDAYLELVNSSHPLSSDTRPTDLVDLAAGYCLYSVKQLRAVPARALTALFLEAAANGIENLKVRNGFLGYYDQSYFHEFYQTRKADIATLAAPPGEAEYQSGLCVDMDDLSGKGDYELSDFAGSETFFWLRDNAWKFGFILRYPEGKEEITGYPFEPWHFRYVGRYHAYQIYTKGICLEEYVANLSEG